MLIRLKNITNLVPIIKETFLRFPLSFISAVSGTLLTLLLIYNPDMSGNAFIFKLIFTLSLSVVALTSVKLFIESTHGSFAKHMISAAVVVGIIFLHVWGIIAAESAFNYMFFGLALMLSLLFSPYIKQTSDASSVWYFNYQTGVAIFFGCVSALVFSIGLSLILVSLGYLFNIEIPKELYGVVSVLAWGILFSIYVLSNIARVFDYEEEGCEFPRGIHFITNYILVPLMFAFMAILYAYFIKISLSWELPRGNLGWMITSFGTIGIVTKLLAYPIRNKGTRLLALFDHYYYYALIVPVILLAVAIFERINEYGFTEQRYAVLMIGVWFTAVTILTVIKKDKFHIKYVPIILAILTLLSSFGPWGAVSVSTSSQLARFEALLNKHNLLVNGQAIISKVDIPFEDRKSISSIAEYLTDNRHRFAYIKPMLSDLITQSEKKDFDFKKWNSGRKITELLHIPYVSHRNKGKQSTYFNYTTKFQLNKVFVDASEFDYVGQFYFTSYSKNKGKNTIDLHHKGETYPITFNLKDNIYSIELWTGENIYIDIPGMIKKLKAQNITTGSVTDMSLLSFTRLSAKGDIKLRLIVTNLRGDYEKDNKLKIKGINHIIMLKII